MYLLKYLHGFPLLQAAFQSPQLYMKIFCQLATHIYSLISCHSPPVPYAPAILHHLRIPWFHDCAEVCSSFCTDAAALIALCSP